MPAVTLPALLLAARGGGVERAVRAGAATAERIRRGSVRSAPNGEIEVGPGAKTIW